MYVNSTRQCSNHHELHIKPHKEGRAEVPPAFAQVRNLSQLPGPHADEWEPEPEPVPLDSQARALSLRKQYFLVYVMLLGPPIPLCLRAREAQPPDLVLPTLCTQP